METIMEVADFENYLEERYYPEIKEIHYYNARIIYYETSNDPNGSQNKRKRLIAKISWR
jgi:hypothetical protein